VPLQTSHERGIREGIKMGLFYILLLTNSWKNHEVQIASLINICIINLIRREPGGQGRNPGKWLPFYWNEVGRES
jgi:hypothetical protein